jgi:hypothetical protein
MPLPTHIPDETKTYYTVDLLEEGLKDSGLEATVTCDGWKLHGDFLILEYPFKSFFVPLDFVVSVERHEGKEVQEIPVETRMLPQANLEPAKESLENAEKFYKNINLIV